MWLFCRANVFAICLNKLVLMFTLPQTKIDGYYAQFLWAFFGIDCLFLTNSVRQGSDGCGGLLLNAPWLALEKWKW